jgi:hypothetical protein
LLDERCGHDPSFFHVWITASQFNFTHILPVGHPIVPFAHAPTVFDDSYVLSEERNNTIISSSLAHVPTEESRPWIASVIGARALPQPEIIHTGLMR